VIEERVRDVHKGYILGLVMEHHSTRMPYGRHFVRIPKGLEDLTYIEGGVHLMVVCMRVVGLSKV